MCIQEPIMSRKRKAPVCMQLQHIPQEYISKRVYMHKSSKARTTRLNF